MADSILDLLGNGKFRAVILDALKKAYELAGTIYDNPQDDMKSLTDEDLWQEAWYRARLCANGAIQRAFADSLFDKMSRPLPVTQAEVSDAFWSMIAPLQYRSPDYDSAYAEGVYAAFLNFVGNHLLSDQDSTPFVVGRICPDDGNSYLEVRNWVVRTPGEIPDDPSQWVDDSDVEAALLLEEEDVWHTDGIRIRQVGTSPCTDMERWNDAFAYLNMRVSGSISDRAMATLATELTRVIPSIIRSVSVLRKGPTLSKSICFFPCERNLPIVTGAIIGKNIGFVRRCLDAYFSTPTKKDSLDRRIQNAVNLLVESDVQVNDAVGLALSIAAIEALLGEKGREINETLSSNVAVLLEPDLEMRVQARRLFKRLYGSRSDALHGRQLDHEGGDRENARCVAAAVLQSVISRQDFLRRSDYQPEHPNDLLRDLENLHWSTGQPMGVSVLPITDLWRRQTSKPDAPPED